MPAKTERKGNDNERRKLGRRNRLVEAHRLGGTRPLWVVATHREATKPRGASAERADLLRVHKDAAIPALDEGLRRLAENKATGERKLQRWSAIADWAADLSECFAALTGEEDFMRMIDDFDERTGEMFKGERIPTLGGWVRLGIRFTAAMRDGSNIPTKYTAELNAVNHEIACATAVRNILRSFVSASDNDYRLRCAPEKYRTRIFRDLAQDFSDIVAASATIELAKLPDTVSGVSDALAVIIDVAKKMQGICRRAKKDIKRLGSLYWTKLDTWDAMRSTT